VTDTVTVGEALEEAGTDRRAGAIVLVDDAGRTVADTEEVLAVYKTIRRRFALVPPADAEGPFKVRFTMDTQRDDLPPGGALPSERVVREVDVAQE